MRVVPLVSTPNQSFTLTLDGARWGVRFRDVMGLMVADISRGDVVLLTGTRVLAGEALSPYRYLETGNFIMLTVGDELPDWRAFGVSQLLIYLTAAEIAAAQVTPLTIGELTNHVPQYLTSDDGFYLTTDTGEILTDD